MKNHLRAVLALTLLGGCIWSPSSRSTRESSASIGLVGEAPGQSQTIDVTARNHSSGTDVVIGSAISSSIPDANGLYPWTLSITPAAQYWAPQLGYNLNRAVGRLELSARVHDDTFTFKTFTTRAAQCVNARMAVGDTAQSAGSACTDGTSLVLYDNSGVASTVPTTGWVHDAGPFNVTTIPFDAPFGAVAATWEVGHYAVRATDDSSGSINVYAVICRPQTTAAPYNGRLRTVIFNHGGFVGVNNNTLHECLLAAHDGWLAAASAYRYENVVIDADAAPIGLAADASWGVSTPSELEYALGEVADVLRLTDIVRARSDSDNNRVLMWGISHGATLTLRAVQQGAPVQAAGAFSPVTDFTAWWWYGCPSGTSPCPSDWVTAMFGNTPNLLPRAYTWRSPSSDAAGLSLRYDVKTFIAHGAADLAVPAAQSCNVAQAAYAVAPNANVAPGITFGAFHIGAAPAAPAQCPAAASLPWTLGSPVTFSTRNLSVYDGWEHNLGNVPNTIARSDFDRFVDGAIAP